MKLVHGFNKCIHIYIHTHILSYINIHMYVYTPIGQDVEKENLLFYVVAA